jgi:phosphatidylserine/phosphatidylglycerophosphate/cardiolipin synthase-like enzyme
VSRRIAGLTSVVAAAALAIGCGGGSDTGAGDGDGAIDAAPDGRACDPDRPRAVAPEVLVGPAGLEERIAGVIDAATGSIDVHMYTFTVDRIVDRLVAADRRGVPVRVILDPSQLTPSTRSRLEAGGVEVKLASASFPNAHAKYVVVGGASGFAVVLSANFTIAGFDDQRNYGVIDRDPEDVADLASIFAADWAGQPAALDCSRLVVSPGDARGRVIGLIAGAQQTLEAELFYLADSAVRQAIVSAHGRGVAVRVLLADPSDMNDNATTADTLKAAGIPVKVMATPDVHAKLLVADGVALIGSHNMSTTSLRDNREVGVIVREGTAAMPARQRFEQDWTAATAW